MDSQVCPMGHAILPHHIRRFFFFQLWCHSNVTTFKKCTICTKTNETLSCLFLSWCPSLHERLNKSEIICSSNFYNTVKCQKDRHSIPCLHHIHMNRNLILIINCNNLIYTLREEPWTSHNSLNFLQDLFI